MIENLYEFDTPFVLLLSGYQMSKLEKWWIEKRNETHEDRQHGYCVIDSSKPLFHVNGRPVNNPARTFFWFFGNQKPLFKEMFFWNQSADDSDSENASDSDDESEDDESDDDESYVEE